MDLPEAKVWLAKFKRRHKVPVIEISCLSGAGLDPLKRELAKRATPKPPKASR
jgi:GTPase